MEEFKQKENENLPFETLEAGEAEKLRAEIAELKKEVVKRIKEAKEKGGRFDYCPNIELADVNPDELTEKDLTLFKKAKEDELTFREISEHKAKEVGPFVMEKLSRLQEEGWDKDVLGEDLQEIIMKGSRPTFACWVGAFWAAKEAKKKLEERRL